MSQYTVTLQLNDQKQFLHFMDTVGPVAGQLLVTVAPEESAAVPPEWREPERREPNRRGPRGSKVNNTILEALQNSTLTVRQLKEALEHAGMSPGSLSTGIAALTKSGQIERVGEGTYALVGMQRAA
jgi:predicted Rossmann fold nucleotide-binding protein DprA/Smf involved in DNA uptake